MKKISKPEIKVIRFKPRDIITASGETNGSGKRPPGWDKPHNPHSKHAPIWGDYEDYEGDD